jgi:hypothetical protein
MNDVWIDGSEQISFLGVGASALALANGDDAAARWECAFPWIGPSPEFEFDRITGLGESPATRQMDGLAKYVVACSSMLLKSREADPGHEADVGIVLGSAFGCTHSNHAFIEELVSNGPRRTSPTIFRNTVSNAAAGHMATTFGIRGSNTVLNSGMVSGAQALAYASDLIREGRCATILAGAVDCVSEPIRARFLAQSGRIRQSRVPLIDGACIFSLRASQATTSSWRVTGYSMAFISRDDWQSGMWRVIDQAIRSSGDAVEEVDALQIHTDFGLLWIRTDPSERLEDVCQDLARDVGPGPHVENTAVPSTLGLADSLRLLAGEAASKIFLRRITERRTDSAKPRAFVFVAIGADGNAVALVFKGIPNGRKDA